MAGKKDPRWKFFKLRLTPAEFETFRSTALSRDMNMSDYARLAILSLKPETERRRRFVFHPVDPSLLRQVAAIGNNLNQLLGWAHSKSETVPPAAIIGRLIAVERALSDLVESQSHKEPPDAH